MKKYFYAAILSICMLGIAASCENDSADAQPYEIDSPDPDEIKRPGGGG